MIGAEVRAWLMGHTPLEPALLEGAGFESMVYERVASAAGGDEAAYLDLLRRSPGEVERLIAGVAVAETWLFRYPRSFDLLVDVLERLLAQGRSGVRMVSVGCATGQEPYCMAMAALHAGWRPEQVVIDAFDRNPESLRIAAAGRYGPASIRGEVPTWATPFLHRDADSVCIEAGVRAMVRFSTGDVSTWNPAGRYDAAFCRNVLIYLNTAARTALIGLICGALGPHGVLFVGHAEQIIRGQPLKIVSAPHAFALERIEPAAPTSEAPLSGFRPVVSVVKRSVATAKTAAPEPGRVVPARAAEEMLGEARDLADAGRVGESTALLRSLITRYGPTAAALELLGLIGMTGEDVDGARRLFEQAVYLEPARSASLLQLAMIWERAGDAKRAASYWDRARRAADSDQQEQRT